MGLAGKTVAVGDLADIQAAGLRAAEQAACQFQALVADVAAGRAAFQGEQPRQVAHRDAHCGGHPFAVQTGVPQPLGDHPLGGQQIGRAMGADAALASLAGDDVREQFEGIVLEAPHVLIRRSLEETLGTLAQGADQQALRS
ncbi:hypothetical protein D3C72_1543030 [compost metagenome]